MQKKWNYISSENTSPELFEKIKAVTGNDLLTGLLISRGINTEKKARDYLNPLKMEFTSPFEFTDMEIAINRIFKAVEQKEFILIHGDFDADGITSTALLSKLMTLLGANYEVYIPNRETESHGLSTKAILQLRAKNKLKLVITCDCATSDIKEINLLKTFGIDTIVTDHHEPAQDLPNAIAIINPKVSGKVSDKLDVDKIESLSNLAGVGVAFKLACAILEKIGQQDFVQELLPLVAVGTIADIVPVLGENRAFIKLGLETIQNKKNRGLFELLKISGINPEDGLKAENIAFQIAPRLNATGRLDTADEGYKLLISDNGSEIDFLCHELNNKNTLRQTLCDKIFQEALLQYENSNQKNEYAIILYQENWHPGVIGIVASKFIERYNKPTLMMCKDSNSDIIRSSARSIEGVNIFELLNEMKECFVSFGGHKGAAGLSFNPKEHSLEEIKTKIFKLAKEYSKDLDLTPKLNIDMKILPQDVNIDLIKMLELLEPCGAKNPYPIFAIENLNLQEQKLIGQKQNHLKFICADSDKNSYDCVFWNSKLLEIEPSSKIDIAFYPKINIFNNVTTLQLDIKDAHYKEIKKSYNIYDHRKKQNILQQVCDFTMKNQDKIYIYINNTAKKNELLKLGFPKMVFEQRSNVSHLMFFDYPSSEEEFKEIISKIKPLNLHFMNVESENIEIDKFVNKVLGMAKYAAHNKNGEFDISAASKALLTSYPAIELALGILEEIDAVQIDDFSSGIYKLKYIKPVSFEEVTETENFEELKNTLNKLKNFKEYISNADEKELAKMAS